MPRSDKIAGLREHIAEDLTRLGSYLTMGFPLTGLVVVNRAERAAGALAMLAEQNPAVLRLLQAVAGASVYAELAFVVGDIVVAAGVERGAIPLEHPLTTNIRQEISIVVAANEEMQRRVAEQAAARAAREQAAADGGPVPNP